MENIISRLKENLLSLLFTIMGTEILFYSMYRGVNIVALVLIPIIVVTLYCIFDYVVILKKKGMLIYLITGIIMLGISYILIKISSDTATVPFYVWALFGGRISGAYFGYVYGGMFFVSFVFTSLTYYFSVNTVRIPMMFLLAAAVTILFNKNMYKLNFIPFIIFIVLLFSLFLLNNKKKESSVIGKINIRVKSKHMMLPGLSMILILFITASLIPRISDIPTMRILEAFKIFANGGLEDGLLEGNKDKENFRVDGKLDRDINMSTTMNSNKIVYTVDGENPLYLIDHNFNLYENNKWKQTEDDIFDTNTTYKFNPEVKDISTEKREFEINQTLEFLKQSSNLNGELQEIKNGINNESIESSVMIRMLDLNKGYIAHPPNVSLAGSSSKETPIMTNQYDEVFNLNVNGFTNKNNYYFTYNYDAPPYDSTVSEVMRYFNRDRYMEFIKSNLSSDKYEAEKGKLFLLEDTYLNKNSITERMSELSNNLTSGKESYYDKALNIEKYFIDGKYKYNLNLPASEDNDNYIDYFIFEGKTGYCVQYATAMTLLCRASGIPARYVEGYSISETDFDGNVYNVKETSAHAFVQVYIPGYGWKIFDPTPAADDDTKSSNRLKFLNNIKPIYMLVILVSIVVVGVGIWLYLYLTRRKRFLKKIMKMSNEEALENIMKNSMILIENEGLEPYDGETLLKFSIRVDRDLNIGFENLVKEYYAYKYAFIPLRKELLLQAKEVNEVIYNLNKEK